MARKPRSDDDDRREPDPETTRAGFPELTRCDHCGVLDDRTEPFLVEKFEYAGWQWAHPECKDSFKPTISHLIRDSKGRVAGAIVHRNGEWEAYRYHTRAEPMLLGWANTAQEAAEFLA